MPLIIICGTPVSGKTYRAKELKDFFTNEHGKSVEIISEDEAIKKLGYDKNTTYLDSQKEKRVRGYLKSEVIRLIGKGNVVILDGSNYIKGYRYELYCASKASKSTQCTVYTIRNHDEAWEENLKRNDKGADTESPVKDRDGNTEPYTEEVFNALTRLRFEEPNSNNRWDSPLFTVQPNDPLDLNAVYRVLFEKKPPPPNMSTQNPPLTSTNFLYELDKVTQTISKQILESKQLNLDGEVKFPEYPGCVLDPGLVSYVNPQKLLRLRRQFLTYAKMNHSNEEASKIGRYFIQYLNKTLTDLAAGRPQKLTQIGGASVSLNRFGLPVTKFGRDVTEAVKNIQIVIQVSIVDDNDLRKSIYVGLSINRCSRHFRKVPFVRVIAMTSEKGTVEGPTFASTSPSFRTVLTVLFILLRCPVQ